MANEVNLVDSSGGGPTVRSSLPSPEASAYPEPPFHIKKNPRIRAASRANGGNSTGLALENVTAFRVKASAL
jgi:hypothetical protein